MGSEPIIYQLSEPDIVAGNDIWLRAKTKMWQALVAGVTLWLLCIFLMLDDLDLRHLGSIALTAISAAVVAAIMLVAMRFGGRWQSRRLTLRYFRDNRAAQQETRATWTRQHFRLEQNEGYHNRPWSVFQRWAEDDAALVLLQTGPVFHALPKRAFTAAQLSDIRACLAKAGVSKAKLFPF